MIKIVRTKYVITHDFGRGDGEEILCGLARSYHFKPIKDVGDTAIKTYSSEKKAVAAFKMSWSSSLDIVVKKIVETIEEVEEVEE